MARLGRTGKRRKTRLVRRKRGELFDYVPSPTTRSGTRRDLRGTDLRRRIRVAERDLREREREGGSGEDAGAFHCLAPEWMRA